MAEREYIILMNENWPDGKLKEVGRDANQDGAIRKLINLLNERYPGKWTLENVNTEWNFSPRFAHIDASLVSRPILAFTESVPAKIDVLIGRLKDKERDIQYHRKCLSDVLKQRDEIADTIKELERAQKSVDHG